MDANADKIARHWSKPPVLPPRTRWWQSKAIVRHINKRFCGKAVDGTDGGDIEQIKKLAGGHLLRGISVGCGNAWHELRILAAGCVESFDLYELSEARRDQALNLAKQMGLAERIRFPEGDPFATRQTYDLVYWKDALHHMPSARAAVQWSRNVLRGGGLFYMNEFVGPTYMQYTERQLDLAERARAILSKEYLSNPHMPSQIVPLRRAPVNIDALMRTDPSECQDSGNILIACREVGATIIPTGGIVYMLALNDILANFDEERDAVLLNTLMLVDDLCVELGESLYAVAWVHV